MWGKTVFLRNNRGSIGYCKNSSSSGTNKMVVTEDDVSYYMTDSSKNVNFYGRFRIVGGIHLDERD